MEKKFKLQIRAMQLCHINDVISLIHRVFAESVAAEFNVEGQVEFMRYANAEAMTNRLSSNHIALVAVYGDTVVGVIEIRSYNHISLLFVDNQCQRKGVGTALYQRAVELCVANNADVDTLTVNASPNSVFAYKRMGFVPTDEENLINGIRFIPMSMIISKPRIQ